MMVLVISTLKMIENEPIKSSSNNNSLSLSGLSNSNQNKETAHVTMEIFALEHMSTEQGWFHCEKSCKHAKWWCEEMTKH